MKIATLAFQRRDNIGAMLQCYALQQSILKNGYESELIDYICDAADRVLSYKSLKVKGLKKYTTSIIGAISRLPKKHAFSKFRRQKLIITKKVNKKSVASLGDAFDGYIVGSDNVWNSKLTGLDDNYFFSFVRNNQKKASYAASLGMGAIPPAEQASFKKWLSMFSIITLREHAAAINVGKLIGKDVTDTCDPTFLLSRDEWKALSTPQKSERKYILVYQMSPSYSFVKFAKEVAAQKGLPIVYVPFPYGPCKCLMKPHIGPCEWLGYMENAEYVITDSFHGCVFAAIYERNLIIKISQLGDRIKNFTEKLGIKERIVSSATEAVELPKLDYTEVRKRIEAYKAEGSRNLKSILDHFSKITIQG